MGSVFPSPWDELDVPLSPFVGWEGGGVSPSPFGGGGEDGNFHWTVLASIVFSYREPWEGQDIKCERRCAPDKLSQVLSSSHKLREAPRSSRASMMLTPSCSNTLPVNNVINVTVNSSGLLSSTSPRDSGWLRSSGQTPDHINWMAAVGCC